MNVYNQKRKWKIVLATAACIIVAVSLWYSNRLISKIKKEEQKKVALWSTAIRNRARLVSYTDDLFKSIQGEEEQKIKFWAQATKLYVQTESDLARDFFNSIITQNSTIPIIQTDKKRNIISWNNIPGVDKRFYSELDSTEIEILNRELKLMKQHSQPLRIKYFKNQFNLLYYRDSHITQKLKQVFEEFIHTFVSETVLNSASVPVLLTDSTQQNVISFGNMDSSRIAPDLLPATLQAMRDENPPLKIELGNGNINYIFFEDSAILKEMSYYPLAQLFTLGLFLFFSYTLFSSFRNQEQNQVWVGMAKETAHQLGTPLSSMMAWVEYLKGMDLNPKVITELGKDLQRLELITDRFSKIGSLPELQRKDIIAFAEQTIDYLRPRLSSRVTIQCTYEKPELYAHFSAALFSWVLENLMKNAVDAMDGEGALTVVLGETKNNVFIDIMDTGKGISVRQQKTVFNPGFTTKSRGWGLGLSLSKRIVENYHKGKIFVRKSDLGKGTTFRILLRS